MKATCLSSCENSQSVWWWKNWMRGLFQTIFQARTLAQVLEKRKKLVISILTHLCSCQSSDLIPCYQQCFKYADCIPCRGRITPLLKKMGCLGYDTKLHLMGRFQFWSSRESEVPPSKPLISGSLLFKVVVSIMVPSLGQINLFKIICVW